MQEVLLEYGDAKMPVEVPDTATIFQVGRDNVDPPAVDPYAATRQALANPLGMPPFSQLVKKGSKVVIAFPDRVKGGAHALAHRRVCIPIIVEELKKAGVEDKDIKLICAMGLHRKNTKEELYWYLGREIVDAFWPDRLAMHDAEDPEGIVEYGYDDMGNVVNVNRDVAEADLAVMIGHVQGNPYGGYSGGYKMCVTGVTTWRSIRCHHCPDTMHRADFIPVNTGKSLMRRQFDSIGQAIEKGMGKKFFCVDAVTDTNSQVLGVYAGAAKEVQEASWQLAEKRTNVYLDIKDKFDIMVFGEPRTFHYGPGMGTNPILMLQAIGANLARNFDVFNDGGVIIAPSLCDGWFNDEWFPSYRKVFHKLQEVADFAEAVRFEDEIAHDPEDIFKYRYAYAYHPFHALSMVSMGGVALKHTSAVFIPGARKPGYARAMGCIPTNTFADALKQAEKYVGKNPRILVLPESFLKVSVHLKRK
ncbi:lactate racemase domain-containing protein [Moorella naiadis]|uniref:lactate racemase domain-containing protein n=1 Tax=Moorella naiadis (nom. illeg.) TaxID=3093670 RepID=UPI003D9C89E2